MKRIDLLQNANSLRTHAESLSECRILILSSIISSKLTAERPKSPE